MVSRVSPTSAMNNAGKGLTKVSPEIKSTSRKSIRGKFLHQHIGRRVKSCQQLVELDFPSNFCWFQEQTSRILSDDFLIDVAETSIRCRPLWFLLIKHLTIVQRWKTMKAKSASWPHSRRNQGWGEVRVDFHEAFSESSWHLSPAHSQVKA